MGRYIDADKLTSVIKPMCGEFTDNGFMIDYQRVLSIIDSAPSTDIVFCKECKYRPVKEDADGKNYGFNLIKPNDGDERCPCLVEDGWYSWMPKDNFYCGYGERRGER